MTDDDEMLPEYDLASMPGAVRGKYYEAAKKAIRIIRLPSELQDAYPDEAAVTDALREHFESRRQAAKDMPENNALHRSGGK